MNFATLHDVYVAQLRDLYSAELQLIKALPRMAKASFDRRVSKAFDDLLAETKGQFIRLQEIFSKNNESPNGLRCRAIESLIDEVKEVMLEGANPVVTDAVLIVSAQRVGHYQMSGYVCVQAFARLLDDDDSADLLEQALVEKDAADKRLFELIEMVLCEESSDSYASC